jgi:sterol desaturase/sphingolipid hydroxylase (fatty acid hydroxylase superfamily)
MLHTYAVWLLCLTASCPLTYLIYAYSMQALCATVPFIRRTKFQPAVGATVPAKEVERVVLFNLLVVVGPVLLLLPLALLLLLGPTQMALQTASRTCPAALQFCAELAVMALVGEALFYGVHRLLHTHNLYCSIHFVHHRLVAPYALGALYAHPLEVLFGNLLPLVAGLLLLRPHLYVCCAWAVLATVGTCSEHAGVAVFWWPKWRARAHDQHHATKQGNYAFLGLADWLCGTAI